MRASVRWRVRRFNVQKHTLRAAFQRTKKTHYVAFLPYVCIHEKYDTTYTGDFD
jgi:hypothetical protein